MVLLSFVWEIFSTVSLVSSPNTRGKCALVSWTETEGIVVAFSISFLFESSFVDDTFGFRVDLGLGRSVLLTDDPFVWVLFSRVIDCWLVSTVGFSDGLASNKEII